MLRCDTLKTGPKYVHEYVEIVRQTGHDNYSYTIHIDAQIRTAFLTAYS